MPKHAIKKTRQRPSWERIHVGHGGTANKWRHASGWTVTHCGHPTSLFPYLAFSPSGHPVKSSNGYAFRTLAIAQEAVEGIVGGRYTFRNFFSEQIDRLVRCRTCRSCGCTDADCRQCIARTGSPCHWIAADLCSACEVPAR